MSPLTNTANIFPIVTHNNTPSPSGTQTQILEYQHRIIPYSKALFDVLWTTSIDGMRLTDENGIIKAVNKAYCSLVGMTEKELIDQSFTVVYASPEDRLRLFSTYQMVFQIGMAQTVFEHHTLLQSGKHCDNEIISMFVDSEKGKRLLLTQFRNFGIHQKIENELRESEAKYRGLFAQSIQPMFECTLDGRLTNANNSLLRLLGYKSFSDIFNLNLLQDVYVNADERRDLLKILEVRGYIRNIEIQIKRRNGSRRSA
jgi:PAS domain S-box-containing protein